VVSSDYKTAGELIADIDIATPLRDVRRMPTSSVDISGKRPTTEQMVQIIAGRVEGKRTSILYLLALFVVAGAMVMLPVIYIGMIGGVAYGVYYHATSHATMLHVDVVSYGRSLVFVIPFLVGAVLVIFMIKPLFARYKTQETGLTIDENNEPRLFAYVERLCEAMGIAMPRQIVVDCSVNASAGFRRGFRSMAGGDLILTIGLPLAVAFTLRELTVVLAHEFGHFAQGTGMRLRYIICSVNGWLMRVVTQRDAWDEELTEASKTGHFAFAMLIAIGLIWLTRRVLWLLMMVGHGISCLVSRQMEYDADRWAAMVAGSAAVAKTAKKLHFLDAASIAAHAGLEESWRARRLCDNLPAMIVAQVARLSKELAGLGRAGITEARTGWFATHPSTPDRIRAAEKLAAKGIIHGDGPATWMFQNFDAMCKAASLVYFREVLGSQISGENLVDTDGLVRTQSRIDAEERSISKYLGHAIYTSRPVLPADSQVPAISNPSETLKKLKEARRSIISAGSRIRAAYEQHNAAAESLRQAATALLFCRAKIKFSPKDLEVSGRTEKAAIAKRHAAERQRDAAAEVLRTYEKTLQKRLYSAIQLLQVPQVGKKLANAGALYAEATRLVSVCATLRIPFNGFAEFCTNYATTELAAELSMTDPENNTFSHAVIAGGRGMVEYMRDCRDGLDRTDYPFEHAEGEVSIGRYLVQQLPHERDTVRVLDAGATFVNNLGALYLRILSRLAHTALRVEAAVGLKPEPRKAAPAGATTTTKTQCNSSATCKGSGW